MTEPRLNAFQVIEDFGGTAKLETVFHDHGYAKITTDQIAKWREREMIPMRHWLKLMQIKPGIDIYQYLI